MKSQLEKRLARSREQILTEVREMFGPDVRAITAVTADDTVCHVWRDGKNCYEGFRLIGEVLDAR